MEQTTIYYLTDLENCVFTGFVNVQRQFSRCPNFTGEHEQVVFLVTFKHRKKLYKERLFLLLVEACGLTSEDKAILADEFLNSFRVLAEDGETEESIIIQYVE